jgi:hAT family C-terminal dimerisation region
VNTVVVSEEEEAESSDQPPSKRCKFDFTDIEDVPPKNRHSELQKYRNFVLNETDTASLREGEILSWWKFHAKDYPHLSLLARKFLCIPASSASSERVFSTSGRIVEERRTSLLPENVDALLIIHNNL